MIKISEKYVIEIGEHFTVAELKVVQKGKTVGKQTLVNLTYHYDIEAALNEVLHRLTRDAVKTDEVINIQDVLHLLMKLRIDFIESKVKEIDIPREKRNLK